MNYEIPAGTARLIKHGGRIALRYHLLKTTTLCLLLSILEDGMAAVQALKQIGIDTEALIRQIEETLTQSQAAEGAPAETTNEQPAEGAAETLPELDVVCLRIVKLLVLEDRLANGKREGDLLLMLAMTATTRLRLSYNHWG